MNPFFVNSDPLNNGKGQLLEVCPMEVLLSIEGMDGCSSVSYFPTRQAIAIDGHVEVSGIESLEQAVAWYALRLHCSGRLRGRPLGYILPCINISYGTGFIQPWVETDASASSVTDIPFE